MWTQVSLSLPVAPANAAFVRISMVVYRPTGVNTTSTDAVWVQDILVEASQTTLPFFEGGLNIDSDYLAAWVGTANASNSVLYTDSPSKYVATNATLVQSPNWSAARTNSLRVVAGYAPSGANTTYANVGSSANAITSGVVAANKTYTILATSYLAAAQTGTLNSLARSISVTGDVTASSTPAPNAAGVTQHRLTFTVPSGATNVSIRLYNGASQGNGDVYWDNILVVEGTYLGTYFDGYTANQTDVPGLVNAAWTGTVDDSTSVASPLSINPTVVPLVFEAGKNLLQASTDGVGDIKNSLYVQTDEGWILQNDTTLSSSTYGAVEAKLETNLPVSVSTAVAQQVFAQKALPEEGASYDIVPIPGHVPFVDFNVGDWVLAPDARGLSTKRRVVSLSLTEDAAGNPQYAVEFDTIFRDNEDRMSRWIGKMGGSLSTQFANAGSSSPVAVGQPYVPPTPVNPPAVPLAPANLAVSSVGSWSTNGVDSISTVTLTWDAVTTNTDGSATIPQLYEVWASPVGSPDSLQRYATVTTNTAVISLVPGQTWTFKVRALNLISSPGAFSTTVNHTPAGPTAPMAAPTAPILTSGSGVLYASWDGSLIGPVAPPPQFRYIYATVSTSAGGTYTRMGPTIGKDGRSISLPGLTVGATYWVKLVAVDGAGVASPASSATSLAVSGVALGDLDASVGAAIAAAKDAALQAQSTMNLLADDSFEANTEEYWDWDNTGVTNVTTSPRTGLRNLRILPRGAAYEGFRYVRALTCDPGEQFYFRAWVSVAVAANFTRGGIEFHVLSGASAAATTVDTFVTSTLDFANTSYLEITGTWTAPAGSFFFRPKMQVIDTVTANIYYIDDIRILRVNTSTTIMDGSIIPDKIAAGAVVAGKIAANAIAAGSIQAGAVVAGTIAAGAVTTNELAAGSVTTNTLAAGAVKTSNISAEVGGQLDISANSSVTIIAGQIAGVQTDADATQSSLETMQTYYSFGPTGAIISTPSSPFAVALRNDRIEMLENGNVVSYWNSGTMYVGQLVGEKVVLGNHQIEKYSTGTVVRSI